MFQPGTGVDPVLAQQLLAEGAERTAAIVRDSSEQPTGVQMLLDIVEQRARQDGAAELALSMAEPDTDLMNFYLRRGYRIVEYWQWPYTNYRSAIMSKPV